MKRRLKSDKLDIFDKNFRPTPPYGLNKRGVKRRLIKEKEFVSGASENFMKIKP